MMRCCVIGDPISHTKSPKIYETWMKEDGISGEYTAIRVTKETLTDFMSSARNLFTGFNVTMPLKELIIPYLDRLDESVFGAVNTVVIKKGKAIGYNTDGLGFLDSLPMKLAGKKVAILGYGGAGRELDAVIRNQGAKTMIYLRNPNKKEGSLPLSQLKETIEECQLLINATPLGMQNKDNFEDISFLESLPKNAIVYDLVYLENKDTKLVEHAKKMGLSAMDGESLLLAQARRSYKLYKEVIE